MRAGQASARTVTIAGALTAAVALAACTGGGTPAGPGSGPPASVSPGSTRTIAQDLEAPWSMVRLEGGSTLISERDSGKVLELTASGSTRTVGRIDGVVHQGEGGLLGLAVRADGGDPTDRELYAYYTSERDNRVVRMTLAGSSGQLRLGAAHVVIDGIPKAANHNGGRIAFGPDGMLYVTCGDASDGDDAQDPDSLRGKILRLEPDGSVPSDNPFPGSLVYSLGHRNPQGIAWDADGRLWASEFGQNTWDELNLIEAGANYGWPEVEGRGDAEHGDAAHIDAEYVDPEYVDPVLQWSTDEASPSGIAIIGDTLYLAGLGGQRLWIVTGAAGSDGADAKARSAFAGDAGFGRLRDVTAGPGGTLWMLTNNTDGRGTPRPGDDRIIQFATSALPG